MEFVVYTLEEYRNASPEQKELYWKWRRKMKKQDENMLLKIERMKPKNKEKMKAYQSTPEYKEKIKAYARDYYAKNEEKMKAYSKARYEKGKGVR